MPVEEVPCGLDVALRVAGGKWKPLILHTLNQAPHRFGELRRLVDGISEKVLIQQLKELQADGIISRTDHHEVPPRVDYTITDFGRTLAQALMPLCAWGETNRNRVAAMLQQRATRADLTDAVAAR